MHIAVVSRAATAAKVRLTVRTAQRRCPRAVVHVLDADGTALPSDGVRFHTPSDLGISPASLHRSAVALEPSALDELLSSVLLRHLAERHDAVLVHLAPGVLLHADPARQLTDGRGPWFAARSAHPSTGRAPDSLALARDGGHSPHLFALRAGDAAAVLDVRDAVVADSVALGRWVDVVVATAPFTRLTGLVGPGSLLPGETVSLDTGSGQLLVDGVGALALDLSGLDPHVPELMESRAGVDPSTRLSEHPVLAQLVEQVASELLAATSQQPAPWSTTSLGAPPDPALRTLYRGARPSPGAEVARESIPDPIAPDSRDELLEWLGAPGPGGGVGRYLRAVHAVRPDLQRAFPGVPGVDEEAYLAWVGQHAVADGFSGPAVTESLRRMPPTHPAPPSPGVNVVGYLQGELGIGESARLTLSALDAVDVPTVAVPVEQHLASRRRAGAPTSGRDTVHDTTVICVNADLTPSIAATVPRLTERSLRIGMWYWEVEEFPASQHAGFATVDEVWVATEFVRAAIAPHAPVPVRVMTPPLPQRRELPALDRADLGIPEGVVFLFSFDYLSTMERKNPRGVVDAYRAAFTASDGTVLVVKSINAALRPVEAERLRRHVADRADIVLLEDYLDADTRDALVALSDCYVSLHRSEGLGLTMAEAMAWGKPVVATAYSGNLQFMTEDNSLLVPWEYAPIPEGADPYPVGGRWAEPDLVVAARLLRSVVDDPAAAQARGRRAAQDIAALHSPAAAGAAMAARLSELARARRTRARRNPARGLRVPLLRHPR
ncbi:MAG: glycosyltransferase [Cellulomonadaceae bacterium]|nr:glycosyltransferase [Cellulomonadaceae bacterium]